LRLDAPKPEQVKAMIQTCIQVESQGLKGKIVLDSRGIVPGKEKPDEQGFGVYDQSLRDLGERIRKHTKLEVLADDKPEVLPPNSAQDVAVYCGWYSWRGATRKPELERYAQRELDQGQAQSQDWILVHRFQARPGEYVPNFHL